MYRIVFCVLLMVGLRCSMQSQSGPQSTQTPGPLYRITFEHREIVGGGVSSSRMFAAPFECTDDGTVFVNMLLQPSKLSPPVEMLVSVSLSGEIHEFRLDQ